MGSFRMKNRTLFTDCLRVGICLGLLVFLATNGNYTLAQDSFKYYSQKAPGLTPEIFSPGTISSKDRSEFGSVFNTEASEFYFGVDVHGVAEVWWTSMDSLGNWTTPSLLVGGKGYSCNDPFLSQDESRLYFISNRGLDSESKKPDYDIWYIQRGSNGWNPEMIALDTAVNSLANEYYMSFTANETIYFSSNRSLDQKMTRDFNIYKSTRVNEGYLFAQILPPQINSAAYEADIFISPDESYMIFCSIRPGGLGEGDLYISFQDQNGNWSQAKNMGDKINTSGHELCPFVSRDGKYFFYTSKQDIYWVNAHIIESFKE